MTKPNWRKWLLMPDVKVWQACVLSIGLEPSTMDFERESWMYPEGTGPHIESENFPNPETEQQYKDLVEILSANLFDKEYFSASVTSGNGAGYNSIRLDEFATWATSEVKWLDLPQELAGLVINKTNGDSAQTQAKDAPAPVALTDAQAAAEPVQAQTNKKTPKTRTRIQQQINAIFAELVRLGYKPSGLPRVGAGQRSAKAEVRENLYGNDLFTAQTAFENAWQELAKRRLIKNET